MGGHLFFHVFYIILPVTWSPVSSKSKATNSARRTSSKTFARQDAAAEDLWTNGGSWWMADSGWMSTGTTFWYMLDTYSTNFISLFNVSDKGGVSLRCRKDSESSDRHEAPLIQLIHFHPPWPACSLASNFAGLRWVAPLRVSCLAVFFWGPWRLQNGLKKKSRNSHVTTLLSA